MNNRLNLASKPFTNRALPWTVAITVAAVSLLLMILIARATGQANAQANAMQVEINGLGQQESNLRQKAEQVKQSLTADQLQTLSAAHELVDHKRFSWSRLFADLEAALPGNIKVSRISVRDLAARGDRTVAELDLAVFAKSSATITEMIGAMDKTGIFTADLRSQNLQKGRGEAATEYELLVIYSPRAASQTSEPDRVASARTGGAR